MPKKTTKPGAARGEQPGVPEVLETKELTPELWPALEELFGSNGACGGCWCMSWRVEKGESWAELKGAGAKQRMKALVQKDQAHGILAFAGKLPVGWCAFDRRQEFAKLDRAPSLACDDAEKVWSLPCFFVRAGYRDQGVAGVLLAAATRAIKARGGKIAEGYPARPPGDGKKLPAAFAWTGTRPLFEKAGFKLVGEPDSKRVRRKL